MSTPLILLAGGTGDLGARIATELRDRGAEIRAIVRAASKSDDVARLRDLSVGILEVDYADHAALVEACRGASCVISALAGLRETIIDAQTQLLSAATEAGVLSFIPSDFSIDFTKLQPGTNRNLDLRREFMKALDAAPIKATSVFNGAFTDMLTGRAPIVLLKFKRIL